MRHDIDYFRHAGRFFLTIFKLCIIIIGTFISMILMITFCILIQESYEKTKNLAQQFQNAEHNALHVIPSLYQQQLPILKVRKQTPDQYHYMFFYQLTAQQTFKLEHDLTVQNPKAIRLVENEICIDPTQKRKWLLPRITRHYLVDKAYDDGSFLRYGSDHALAKIESFCQQQDFLSADFKLKNSVFNQFHVRFNSQKQLLMLNFMSHK